MASLINIGTYNLHGFNNGQNLLPTLCEVVDILVVQEHWLAPYNLYKFTDFHNDFQGFAWSALADKLKTGLLVGRPFGGLGLLIRKSLNSSIKIVGIMDNCRCVALHACVSIWL